MVTTLLERFAPVPATITGCGAKLKKLQVPGPAVTRHVARLVLPPPALSLGGTLLGAMAVPPPLIASGPACAYVNFVGPIWINPTADGVLKLGLPTLTIVMVSPAGSWNCCVVVIVTVPFKRCAPVLATIARVGCGNDEVVSAC